MESKRSKAKKDCYRPAA